MLTSATTGLLTGLGLIVAIGAQNAYVLRQGLTRRHVGAVVAVCAVSDVVLIAAGVAGVGSAVEAVPGLITLVRCGGVAFLTWYGVTALRRARHATSLEAATGSGATLGRAVRTALALTWLNPHVYLDTVLLLGSVGATTDRPAWFAVGAGVASVVWFTALGYGARLLARPLARPGAWRALDVLVGLTMLAIAATLALGA
ncbi:MAG: amino acid transporter [Nocardioides sp.]|nr:amino acid transporter [Nocardioides sp.]